MSNSLRSNSAIFMLNTKSQSLSTFTNLFRLPPPGYTLPASNILHKLTHQPWKLVFASCTTSQAPSKFPHIPLFITCFSAWPTRGSPRGNSGLRNCERVPPRIFSHLPNIKKYIKEKISETKKKDTLQKGIFFVIYLGEFSRVNLHTRSHSRCKNDTLHVLSFQCAWSSFNDRLNQRLEVVA